MASPSCRMGGWGGRCSEVVDGLDDLAVDLDIAAVYGEAPGVRACVADAQDGGDARARLRAVYRDLQGVVEAHVEAQHAAGSYQLEHTLLVGYLEPAIFAAGMWAMHQIAGVARVERAIGNLFDEVGKSEVRFLVVLQGQRVAFAAQLDDEGTLDHASFDLETERQAFTLGGCPENVVEGLGQVDLGVEQLQGAVVDFVLDHAACPPPFGSNGVGAGRASCFGLLVTNEQPLSRAKRRISKMRKGSAAAGWTCRVAVVCIVLLRSVVEE